MIRSNLTVLAVLLALALCSGCTTVTRSSRKQVIKMAPLVFYAKGGKVVRIESQDEPGLLREGAKAFRARNYRLAARIYRRILVKYPRTPNRTVVLYNLGLALEELKEYRPAAQAYATIIKLKKSKDLTDALFRLGNCREALSDWPAAVKVFTRALARPDLSVQDRIEAMARIGRAEMERGNPALAEQSFRMALRLYRKASKLEYLGPDYFAGMAQHLLGRIYDQVFRKRAFHLPKTRMKKDLEFKARNTLKAQGHYLRAIRIRNPKWVMASIFAVGDMYRQMYDDMVGAPVPQRLSVRERRIYEKMLRKRIRILLTKATYTFEQNLRVAEVLGLRKSKWFQKSIKRLREIRRLVIKVYLSGPAAKPKKARPKPTPVKPPKGKPTAL